MGQGEEVRTYPSDSPDALADHGQNPDGGNAHQETVASPCRRGAVAYPDRDRSKGRPLVDNPLGPYLADASRDPVHKEGEAFAPLDPSKDLDLDGGRA